MEKTLRSVVLWVSLIVTAAPAWAQQTDDDATAYQLPKGWIIASAPGLLPEPSLLSKFALSSETAFGRPPREGLYVQTSGLITGQGWISLGPGYRRTVLGGRGRVDMSAAVSWYLSRPRRCRSNCRRLRTDGCRLGPKPGIRTRGGSTTSAWATTRGTPIAAPIASGTSTSSASVACGRSHGCRSTGVSAGFRRPICWPPPGRG